MNGKLKESDAVLLNIVASAQKLSEEFGKSKGFKDFMESQAKAKTLTEEANEATKKRTQTLSDLERALLALKKAQSEDAVEIQQLRAQTALLNKENKDQARTVLGLVTPYQKFAKEVNEAKNRAKSLGAEMILLEQRFKNGELSKGEYNRQINKLSKEFVEARLKAAGLDQQIKKIDASVGDSQRNVGNYKSALGGLTTSFRSLLGAMGVVGGVALFGNLLKESYETVKKLDAQNNALKQIFETEAQIGFQKEYLADVTQRYGLELVSATDGYTKYAAAVKGTAIEGEKARNIFSSFSGASAKLGLSADQQAGIFKALEQMISKGTVQAEELRGQLGDRMPGAFKLFADAAGVSTKELGEMLKKGEVLADDILPKVAEKLNETYNLGTGAKIDTLAAAQNRLKNSWTSFLDQTAGNKELINGLAFGMEGLGTVLNFLLDTLIVKGDDGVSVVGDLVEILESLFGAVTDITEGLGLMDAKTKNSLFSMNQFKNDLQAIQATVSVVTGFIKYLAETIGNLFKVHDGFSGWVKDMNDSANKLLNTWSNYKKVQDGVIAANAAGEVFKNEGDAHAQAWEKAKKSKKDYFQLNGKYFTTFNGKNTGKSVDDYIDRQFEGGTKLVAKDKSPANTGSGDDPKKPKGRSGGNRGSRLSGEQRDYLMSLQALRDLELAINEKRYTESEIEEKKYLENLRDINLNYFDKKIAYLKGRNAKEKLEEARAQLDRAKLIKETQKKIFDIDFKANEEIHKIKMEQLDKQSKEIEANDYLNNTDRLTKQINIDNDKIEQSTKYWQEQIDLAKAANQETLAIERKRDEEINKIQDDRFKRISSEFDNFKKDVEDQTHYLQTLKGISFEEQKQLILSDKKLSNKQKEYLLDVLSLENQKEQNLIEIDNLQKIKERLDAKAKSSSLGANILTPEEAQQLADTVERLKYLENANIEIEINLKDKLSPQLEAIKDIFTNGFRDLGLQNFADQFDDLFDKIKAGSATTADYVAASMALIGDLGSQYIEQRKEQQIAALDEQLAHTQQTTEQELEFINDRLSMLNSLQNASKEQIEERNALEDEARVIKEQQFQREKAIATQKARAEQRAAANQALINGFLGASKSIATLGVPAGLIPAAIALGFGAVQAGLIMSKDPTPQYFVGRKDGPAEMAWTQEKGREIIAGKDGKIKSLGSDKGATLTKLDAGDKVFTATESMKLLSQSVNVGDHLHKIDNSRLSPIVFHQKDYSNEIAEKVTQGFDRIMKKYDKISYSEDEQGNIFQQEGGKIPLFVGRKKKSTIVINPSRNERN